MKLGNLYSNKDGDILLYEGSYLEDYHTRVKMYRFKIIVGKSLTEGDFVELSANYLNYLKELPHNHPAWILYGAK